MPILAQFSFFNTRDLLFRGSCFLYYICIFSTFKQFSTISFTSLITSICRSPREVMIKLFLIFHVFLTRVVNFNPSHAREKKLPQIPKLLFEWNWRMEITECRMKLFSGFHRIRRTRFSAFCTIFKVFTSNRNVLVAISLSPEFFSS